MKAEIHEGVGLQYITIVPDEYTPESIYPLVIMLHGFGANMQDLAGLAPPSTQPATFMPVQMLRSLSN